MRVAPLGGGVVVVVIVVVVLSARFEGAVVVGPLDAVAFFGREDDAVGFEVVDEGIWERYKACLGGDSAVPRLF